MENILNCFIFAIFNIIIIIVVEHVNINNVWISGREMWKDKRVCWAVCEQQAAPVSVFESPPPPLHLESPSAGVLAVLLRTGRVFLSCGTFSGSIKAEQSFYNAWWVKRSPVLLPRVPERSKIARDAPEYRQTLGSRSANVSRAG